MAAMLPMYNALQTAVNASGDPSYIQQNFKNQAAVVAAACMPNPLLFASQSLNAVTESSPAASNMSYTGLSNQPKTSNQNPGLGCPTELLSALELHDFGDYLIERAKEGCHNAAFPASFFGVEDTLLPSTSKSLSMEQRSSSCETKPSSSSMRSHESMHDEQQAEELANADFELDRLVSLVARQNDANIIAPLPTASSSLFSLDAFKTPDKSDKQPYLLNPPQFTPPDSPTNEDTEQKPCSTILSLSTSQPFVFPRPTRVTLVPLRLPLLLLFNPNLTLQP
uniref:Uncharacterized protein n=1 Tax=Ditylenchus dipsaci TaxID=166011 RepID=A0A915EMT3_9BILA